MQNHNPKNLDSDLVSEKKTVRTRMKKERAAISDEMRSDWNARLIRQVLQMELIRENPKIYCYISYGTEIDTKALIQALLAAGKRIACPRVNGETMDFYEIEELSDCVPGYRGILEPGEACKKIFWPTAPVILPGLAFTKAGDRIGYGGGYYDCFLAGEPNHPTLAMAYPLQLVEKLPVEPVDQKTDYVITPEQILNTKQGE